MGMRGKRVSQGWGWYSALVRINKINNSYNWFSNDRLAYTAWLSIYPLSAKSNYNLIEKQKKTYVFYVTGL